jgi:hypothetical protein
MKARIAETGLLMRHVNDDQTSRLSRPIWPAGDVPTTEREPELPFAASFLGITASATLQNGSHRCFGY